MEQPLPPIQLRATLRAHNGWVTQIATNINYSELILSCSRDKKIIIWKLNEEDPNFAVPMKELLGHSHFVSDVVFSYDGNYAFSGSWDKSIKLWDLVTGQSTRRFNGHTNDVLGVACSPDSRHIISASRDKTIKLWNTLAECKYTIQDTQWVSRIRFVPNRGTTYPKFVSCGWDKTVKVWNLQNCSLNSSYRGHVNYLNAVAVSDDGTLCASGGRDCKLILWDLVKNKRANSLELNNVINALCFSPNRYWLCAAAGPSITIWDVKNRKIVDEVTPKTRAKSLKAAPLECISLAWSSDGRNLLAGYSDNMIRVWKVTDAQN